MPIYMDRHDVSKEVTAESVAHLHQEDLKIQHNYNCRGLTYWFDDKRKTAFCLVEAPNAESVYKMHEHSHGELPHSIIEVNPDLVESFLGRLGDPVTNPSHKLNIIDEPAYRFLLSIQIQIRRQSKNQIERLPSMVRKLKGMVVKIVNEFHGDLVQQESTSFLVSFTQAQIAIQCGEKLQASIGQSIPSLSFSLGLDSGLPVDGNKLIFEDTIRTSKRLSEIGKEFSVSPEVQKLYEADSLEINLNPNKEKSISVVEMIFFEKFFEYLEGNFSNSELRIDSFASNLGYSRSQAYRNCMNLAEMSPNYFLKKYRLERSLKILEGNPSSISETGFLCGFSSSSYFSKCFRGMYGVSPKDYQTAIHAQLI
ncbi:nickel-binding protein [Algoriphagus zhangzhouensis]|uniref:AraC-type DNA-binding protein n=1 Tax=Algoriphagus zhangzhouensis TaxID=1073327 RepID=A0A1M7ZCJ8_9BACT|nr:nickel-binding protein [Algoriphagus zhangzhouensis]TDY45615.1 AraC family transcriptional regulator [Algoriphagus zhangzhouensis]SHO62641.1 AraC-type DNA-binding protein [Algoriphagus zhangzhouensis]